MPDVQIHPAALDDSTLLAECEVRRQRRSGPGGQHRNKVETAVFLLHRPTQTEASASERRSQLANRMVALKRLRLQLAIHVRSPLTRDRPLSGLWRTRLVNGRISVSATHRDFAVLLAEALDVIADEQFDAGRAALRLDCTSSQLVRFVKLEPQALLAWNRARQQLGLHELH